MLTHRKTFDSTNTTNSTAITAAPLHAADRMRVAIHDINNDLMTMHAACDRLDRTCADGRGEATIALIRDHIDHIGTRLDGVMARQTLAPQTPVPQTPVSHACAHAHHGETEEAPQLMTTPGLRDYLNSLMPSLSLMAGEAAEIELGAVMLDKRARVYIRRRGVFRVLQHLIRNAAENGCKNTVARIAARQPEPDRCEISVSDNGPGINGVDPSEIFLPGVSTKSKGNGGGSDNGADRRGYGLAAVAEAVRGWGGEVGASSLIYDGGCRIWFSLPLLAV